MVMEHQPLGIEFSANNQTLYCCGSWVLLESAELVSLIESIKPHADDVTAIDATGIDSLDSAGAIVLLNLIALCNKCNRRQHLVGLNTNFKELLGYIAKEQESSELKTLETHEDQSDLYIIGERVIDKYRQWVGFLAFLGELMMVLVADLKKPLRLAWDTIFEIIDNTGLKALPIIGLMSFLIGLVLAYQLSGQLRSYGADIFVVDITGIGILREFGPLITAIVMAGRTSTSFAALIGTMKVNEELDALNAMGVTPMSRLIAPRIMAVVIVMPLLIVWADIFGIFGSMFMSKVLLGISYISFIDRFHSEIDATQYVLGLVKAPVFALIIAGVGCLQGTLVGSSADSVGKQTTKAAVQAIFMVIIADAAFSIMFSWMNL